MTEQEIIVVCIKWGKTYPVHYSNMLYQAVKDNLDLPHRFVCLTDEKSGLHEGIEAIDIPDFPLPRELWAKGMWPKLTAFTKGMFPDGAIVLFMDVDIVITQSLTPFIERVAKQGGLHIIREWNPAIYNIVPVALRPDRGANSSVFGFIAGQQDHILESFEADPMVSFKKLHNDQRFINKEASGKKYWPHAWCKSFKRSCVWYYPLNRVLNSYKIPRGAKIMVFHGNPNPEDLVRDDNSRWGSKRRYGFGPVSWVKGYWNQYS